MPAMKHVTVEQPWLLQQLLKELYPPNGEACPSIHRDVFGSDAANPANHRLPVRRE